MFRILVTGAAGFIGSHVAEKLAKDGNDVVGIDNFSPYYNRKLKESNVKAIERVGSKFYELDLVTDNLGDVVKNIEYIVHCAAQPGLSSHVSYKDYKRNNIDATKKLLESLVGSETLISFIHISTSSVYGKYAGGDEETKLAPASDYGFTKLDAEKIAFEYYSRHKLPIGILRLFSVIGPRERPEKLYSKLIRLTLNDGEFELYEGSGEHIRSYTYVGDIVDGILLALFNPKKSVGEVFNIGGVEEITTKQGIDLVQKILNKKIKIKKVPAREGDQLYTSANIEKAREVLGYNPKTSFEEAIKKQIEWYIDEIHNRF